MDARLPKGPEALTDRQIEVARLVAEGLTNRQIADALGISLDGAKYHVSELLGRLGLERREEIAAWYRTQRGSRLTRARRRLGAALGLPLVTLAGATGTAASVAVVLVLWPAVVTNESGNQPAEDGGAHRSATSVRPGGQDNAHHPVDARTGIPEVDAVMDAVIERDTSTLEELIEYTRVPCTHESDAWHLPACFSGEPEGTLVDAFPVCRVSHRRESSPLIERYWLDVQRLASRPHAVVSVHGASEELQERWPLTEHLLVFSTVTDGPALVALVSSGGLVGVDGCGRTASQMIHFMESAYSPLVYVIHPPESSPWIPVHVDTRRTGVDHIDAAIQAAIANDHAALNGMGRYLVTPCVGRDEAMSSGRPECLPDEMLGTSVEIFTVLDSPRRNHIRAPLDERIWEFYVPERLDASQRGLYAVIVYDGSPIPESWEDFWPELSYLILFSAGPDVFGIAMADDAILGLIHESGITAPDWLQEFERAHGPAEYVVAPPLF